MDGIVFVLFHCYKSIYGKRRYVRYLVENIIRKDYAPEKMLREQSEITIPRPPRATNRLQYRIRCSILLHPGTKVAIFENTCASRIKKKPPPERWLSCIYVFYLNLVDISDINSSRVRGSERNMPVKAEVVVAEPCFSMPRICIHICDASMTTATPVGLSAC